MAKVVIAFACVYVIWGSTYLAIRVAVQTLPPLTMAGVRFVVAGGLLYGWFRRAAPRPTLRQWQSAGITGALMLLGGNGAVVVASTMIDSGVVALLIATVPFWMVFLNAARRGGVRPTLIEIAGLGIGFVGVWILVSPDTGGDGISPLGAGLVLFASLSWAIGSLHSRRAALPDCALLAAGMEMLAGGALLLMAGFMGGEWAWLDTSRWSLRSLGALSYLITFGSLVGFTAYTWLLRVSTPAKVGTFALVNPAIAVLLGWAILSEPVTASTIAASALIVLAVALVTTRRSRAPSSSIKASVPPPESPSLRRRPLFPRRSSPS